MKKILSIILMFIVMSVTTVIFAANESYSIELVSNKTELKAGEEVEVTLKIKNFQNINEGIYAFSAKIEYDKTVFETLSDKSFTAENGWSAPIYNATNGMIISDTSTGVKTASNVLKIKLKVKEDAVNTESAKIKVTDFVASEGEVDIEAQSDATTSLKIATTKNPTNGGSGGNNGSGAGNNNDGKNEEKGNEEVGGNGQKQPETSNKDLPKTGIGQWTIIAVVITAIGGLVSYIKYRRAY